jgi:hypothetical protein
MIFRLVFGWRSLASSGRADILIISCTVFALRNAYSMAVAWFLLRRSKARSKLKFAI